MENPDYIDPDDETPLSEVEKEILEMAKIEEKRFENDDYEEEEAAAAMPTKSESPATVSEAKGRTPLS